MNADNLKITVDVSELIKVKEAMREQCARVAELAGISNVKLSICSDGLVSIIAQDTRNKVASAIRAIPLDITEEEQIILDIMEADRLSVEYWDEELKK